MNTENGTNDCKQLQVVKKEISVDEYLETFAGILKNIDGDNVVIGGTHALKLHGIKMSRPAADLDIILFQPSQHQLQFLDSIRMFNVLADTSFTNRHHKDSEYPIEKVKLMKFKQKMKYYPNEELALDIIQTHLPLPGGLLLHLFEPYNTNREFKKLYRVNSVSNIIEAKMNYTFEKKNEEGLKQYIRQKDVIDIMDLKNSNFNYF